MTTTTKTRPSKQSDAERAAAIEEAHAMIAEQVEAIRTSDDWKRWMSTMAQFHTYSFNNVILAYVQCMQRGMEPPTRLAGFNTWLKVNRGVRKGERGLKIFAPIIVKIREGEQGYPGTKCIGFRLTSTFDFQQTDGEPLPEPAPFVLPEGEAPEGMWDSLVEFVKGHGFTVERGDTGQARGYMIPKSKKIIVRDDLVGQAAVRTLVHETAHMLLHADDDYDYRAHRGTAETEAEGAAYVVGTYFGLDMSTSSAGYIAGWSPEVDTVVKVGQNITRTARKIIDHVESAIRPAA